MGNNVQSKNELYIPCNFLQIPSLGIFDLELFFGKNIGVELEVKTIFFILIDD